MVKSILIDNSANQALNSLLTEKKTAKTGLLIGTVKILFFLIPPKNK